MYIFIQYIYLLFVRISVIYRVSQCNTYLILDLIIFSQSYFKSLLFKPNLTLWINIGTPCTYKQYYFDKVIRLTSYFWPPCKTIYKTIFILLATLYQMTKNCNFGNPCKNNVVAKFVLLVKLQDCL